MYISVALLYQRKTEPGSVFQKPCEDDTNKLKIDQKITLHKNVAKIIILLCLEKQFEIVIICHHFSQPLAKRLKRMLNTTKNPMSKMLKNLIRKWLN